MTSRYQDELLREIGEAQMTYQEFLDYLMPVSKTHRVYQQVEEVCKNSVESVKDRKTLIEWLRIYSCELYNHILAFRDLPDTDYVPPPAENRDEPSFL